MDELAAEVRRNEKCSPTPGPPRGQCPCGTVRFEIYYPACWAWRDYKRRKPDHTWRRLCDLLGGWRKHFRIMKGEENITLLFYETRVLAAHGEHSPRYFRSRIGCHIRADHSRSVRRESAPTRTACPDPGQPSGPPG